MNCLAFTVEATRVQITYDPTFSFLVLDDFGWYDYVQEKYGIGGTCDISSVVIGKQMYLVCENIYTTKDCHADAVFLLSSQAGTQRYTAQVSLLSGETNYALVLAGVYGIGTYSIMGLEFENIEAI